MAHGVQKLLAAFGGYGLEDRGQKMVAIDLVPGVMRVLLSFLMGLHYWQAADPTEPARR